MKETDNKTNQTKKTASTERQPVKAKTAETERKPVKLTETKKAASEPKTKKPPQGKTAAAAGKSPKAAAAPNKAESETRKATAKTVPASLKSEKRAATAEETSKAHKTPTQKVKPAAKTAEETPFVKPAPETQPEEHATSSARTANEMSDKEYRIRTVILIACAFLLVFCFVLALVLVLRGGKEYTYAYQSATLVRYDSEELGTVERKIPQTMRNEGLEQGYPKYGYTQNLTTEQKLLVISESSYLCTRSTANASGTYDKMDQNGFLYLTDGTPVTDTNGAHRQLYKHTAAEGMYLGDVADSEPGIIKRITLYPRAYTSYYDVTGLYAPAGEVIKLQISEEDMNATNGIAIHIGQALYNGQANNIWEARNVSRMPVILNTFNINKNTATLENGVYTAYIGSYLGGPIYVRDERVTFSVTVSGAVRYSHFILGYTSPEEFKKNAESTAPYFDLEVWENGVLHSGPVRYAKAFDYDDLYDAAVLWEKISLVTTRVSTQGVVFLYDPFVAAGAAVAFPGRRSVNCPMGWMSNSLNYKTFVTSGAWGNMHEYHHNFQGWGMGNGGEVTNNALSLISYSLFTNISASRNLSNYGAGSLSGWNAYTSATWALDQITESKFSNGRFGLAVYATLLHNFGQEALISMIKMSGGQSVDKWFNACVKATHYDMSYYFEDMLGHTVSDALKEEAKQYSMFVPVSCVYQTGRTYKYGEEKVSFETMRPYLITYGENFTLDLSPYYAPDGYYKSGSVILPDGFSYEIKSVSSPESGKLKKVDDYTYTYEPGKNMRSGKFTVVLKITSDDGLFEVDDVELTLELEQTHEFNKTMLERTTYTYDTQVFQSAVEAYEKGYAGYAQKTDGDNVNPVQNSNTDVWYYAEDVPENGVVEVRGKIYADEAGKYRIALRGRWNCALYFSLDGGKSYQLGGKIETTGNSPNFNDQTDENVYTDFTLEKEQWVYFKAVMITGKKGDIGSFIGVGWGKYTPATGVYDEEGNLIGETPESISISYASGYRSSYEFPDHDFESEYFYKRTYNYTYSDIDIYGEKASLVDVNYEPWSEEQNIGCMFDGNPETNYHSKGGQFVSESKPFILTVDLGEKATADSMTFYGYTKGSSTGNLGMPKNFVLYGSNDGSDFFEMGRFNDCTYTGRNMTVTFEEKTFRYYRIIVSLTDNARYFAMNRIEFQKTLTIPDGKLLPADSLTYTGKWTVENTESNFGHVHIGNKNSEVSFKFEGTRFALVSSSEYKHSFDVYIDGKKISSEKLKEDDGKVFVSYLSPELKNKTHNIIIKCKSKSNLDSIIVW